MIQVPAGEQDRQMAISNSFFEKGIAWVSYAHGGEDQL
jgi:hypothetical protein